MKIFFWRALVPLWHKMTRLMWFYPTVNLLGVVFYLSFFEALVVIAAPIFLDLTFVGVFLLGCREQQPGISSSLGCVPVLLMSVCMTLTSANWPLFLHHGFLILFSLHMYRRELRFLVFRALLVW